MSNHKTPLTKLEKDGLIAHGLGRHIGKPSQLADVFRQGVAWALAHHPAPTQQPLTDATIDSLYQHMAADERTKTFTAQNWFQAGIAMAEAAHTGSKT